MNEVYKVLNKAKAHSVTEDEPRLSKEEFAKKMSDKRNALYQMAEEQVKKIANEPQSFLQYLSLQSRLDYTVTNTLLVLSQNSNAKMLKDSLHWRDNKSYIKKGEKGIQILEPKGEYQKSDGSFGTNYVTKYVFDISQVNTNLQYKEPNLSTRDIISGLVYESPVDLYENPEPVDGDHVRYSYTAKAIFFTQNLEPTVLLSGLAREYCYAEMDLQNAKLNRKADKMIAESASYMLCQKYGIEVKDTSFVNDVPFYFDGKNSKEIKDTLNTIKGLCDSVSQRMERGIYNAEQQRLQNRSQNVR